jgi:SAM-dependent methyltransferase
MLKNTLKALLPNSAINALRRWKVSLVRLREGHLSSADFWSQHHVDAPSDGFTDPDASLRHLHWRNQQYPGHSELMPVSDADDLVVVDYGCGPGNDIVGLGTASRPKQLIAFDISPIALQLAARRAQLHSIEARFGQLSESSAILPLDANSVDLIHSAGVLHHTVDPVAILREFRRVLKPDGCARVMVYNRNSVWMHLHVAYEMRIANGLYADISKEDAFARTTDGESCPIARCYRPDEFLALAEQAGFKAEFVGSAVSLFELKRLPMIYDALKDQRLDRESADFLAALRFNDRLWPIHDGQVAGINGYFLLRP